MSHANIGLALLAVSEVPNFYSGLLPSLWTIGHFTSDQNDEAHFWIRRGEVMATGLTLTVGIATSILAQSPIPLIGVVLMAGILLYLYEHALHHGKNAVYN